MKTIVFFMMAFLIGCSSVPDPFDVFDNNYSDFLAMVNRLEMDDRINSFRFKNVHSYVIIERTHGRITVDDKNGIYLISDSYPRREDYYSSKEDLFMDIRMDKDILSGYLLFFNKYRSFSSIGHYSRTLSYQEIKESNKDHFSSEVIKMITCENAFLKKINKTETTYKFIRFGENIGFMIFGGIYIYYSPDIDLSELSKDELLIFGFKWIKETSYKGWYEIAY
jgi:hypothetical protein